MGAYCRVSTDKEDQANSFDSQKKYFEEYISRNPEWELYEIFVDEGISGTTIIHHGLILSTLASDFCLFVPRQE